MSLNDRTHWAQKASITKALRHEVRLRAKSMKLPQGLEHCVAQYVWYAPNRIRRDEDNIVLSAKPLFDGLVDYGLVPDDAPEYMTKLMPLIEPHPIKGKQSTAVRVWVAPNQRALFAKGQDEE